MTTKKEPTTGLHKLLEAQLADIYFAEKQLLEALPKMAKKAVHEDLRAAFEGHLHETHAQIERLEQVFTGLKLPAKGKTCPAILGLLQECNDLMEEFGDDEALDAALIAGALKVEHYEIASYNNLTAWAEQLGLEDVVGLLNETLDEEMGAEVTLTEIGEEVLNAVTADEDKEGNLVLEEGVERAPTRQRSDRSLLGPAHRRANGSNEKPQQLGAKR